jgi:hypothetical protein
MNEDEYFLYLKQEDEKQQLIVKLFIEAGAV